VQCKQWRSQKIGVSMVREMFGILKAENAASVSIMTSGMFTQEAKQFANDKPIDFIDGQTLFELIFSVQNSYRAAIKTQVTVQQ
jgi:restriction system protein